MHSVDEVLHPDVSDTSEHSLHDATTGPHARLLQAIFEMSLDGIFIETLEGKILDCNEAACRMFGYTHEEMVGLRIHDLVPEDFAKELPDVIEEDTDGKALERVNRRKDGTLFPTEIHTKIIDLDGERRLIAYVRDMSEKKRVEAYAVEAESKFRSIVEQSLVGIYIIQDNRLVYVNPRMEEITGYGPSLKGMSAIDIIHPDDRDTVRNHIQKRIEGEIDQVRYPFRFLRPDGQTIYVEAHGMRFEYEGRPAIMGALLDVTDKVEYERELIEARERAEEMNRLKTNFLANMSHEIRTPLTSIIGYADVLSEEIEGTPQELLAFIRQSGERLMETLNSVLDLAQIESKSIHIDLRPLDLYELAQNTVQLFSRQAEGKGLSIRLEQPADVRVMACIDQAAFNRVLNNLVSNAIKFTHEGEVVLSVDKEGDRAVVRVRDTGIGIGEAFKEHLFHAFRQESTGQSREYEGSGLGLVITRHLVELMGGEIHVESTRGVGSTFIIRFPAAEPEGEPVDRLAAGLKTMQGKYRILAVDDHDHTRTLFKRMLGKSYEVDTVATATELIEAAGRTQYDVVLVDINLGGNTSGVDLLGALRKMPGYRKTAILACTAYALPGDQERFLSAGFDGYISKPFTRQQLTTTIQQVVGSKAG